jgi:hypothetical protein
MTCAEAHIASLLSAALPSLGARNRVEAVPEPLLALGLAQPGADLSIVMLSLHDLDALSLRDQIAAARTPQLVRRAARGAVGIEQPSRRAQFGDWRQLP